MEVRRRVADSGMQGLGESCSLGEGGGTQSCSPFPRVAAPRAPGLVLSVKSVPWEVGGRGWKRLTERQVEIVETPRLLHRWP